MLVKVIITILRPLIFLFFPYRAVGKENIPATGGAMLCANHVSNWDPPFLILCQPRLVRFMAKAELFRFKPLGAVISSLFGAFPVSRGKGDTAALETAQKIVEDGELLGIFPEGTRSKDGRMLRFKSGAALIAARTGATVIPCGIDRRARLFRRVTITFGEPITAEELHLTGEQPDLRYATRLLAERIRALSGQEIAK